MIVKVKSFKRAHFKKLLAYIQDDTNRLYNKEGKSFVITHNIKGNTIQKWVEQFKANEEFRKIKRTDSVILTHEILSWHRADTKEISIKKLEQITREYIQKRNPNGMYIAMPHFDKEHYHIHICVSGIEYRTGKGMRMTKQAFGKLKKDIQDYQKEYFPELEKSIVEHGKKERLKDKEKNIKHISDKEYQFKLRTGRQTEKEKVLLTLQSLYKSSNSFEDFYMKIKNAGLKLYQRNGKITGVMVGKYKFRFSRLGYAEEKTKESTILEKRTNQLQQVRKKEKNSSRNR